VNAHVKAIVGSTIEVKVKPTKADAPLDYTGWTRLVEMAQAGVEMKCLLRHDEDGLVLLLSSPRLP